MKFRSIKRTLHPLRACRSHQHSDWELIYNVSGTGTMSIQGKSYPFSPGTVVLLPPQIPHCKISDDTFEDYYILFSTAKIQTEIYVFQDDCDQRIYHLLHILYSTYHEQKEDSICNALFDALLGIVQPFAVNQIPGKYVQMLQRRILSGFLNPEFALKDAVSDLPMNQDYLRRRFKQCFGCAPHVYLLQLRVDNAKQLLSEGNYTVAEAAYCSGFSDPLYFSRMFKKMTGVSPKQWK